MNSKVKRTIAVILSILTVLSLAACSSNRKTTVEQKDEVVLNNDSNILVVYYTWSGHLDSMAHWIADETGGDIIRVLAKEAYPEDYNSTADRAKKEKDEGIRPEITLDLSAEDLAKYDTIFFGFPVWWYDLPMCMWTFLESTDLSGKTVIPFFSHEGSSNGANSLDTLVKLAEGADVRKEDALSIRGGKVDGSENEVREWVKNLGYSKEQ